MLLFPRHGPRPLLLQRRSLPNPSPRRRHVLGYRHNLVLQLHRRLHVSLFTNRIHGSRRVWLVCGMVYCSLGACHFVYAGDER